MDMTSAIPAAGDQPGKPEQRVGSVRSGVEMDSFTGVAKINMATGEMTRIYTGRAPGNGAMLATAGDLVFWGDLGDHFRAFDAINGKTLWETTLQGPIQNSTITYGINGKQYIAVLSGEGLLTERLMGQVGLKPTRGHNAVHVFALP